MRSRGRLVVAVLVLGLTVSACTAQRGSAPPPGGPASSGPSSRIPTPSGRPTSTPASAPGTVGPTGGTSSPTSATGGPTGTVSIPLTTPSRPTSPPAPWQAPLPPSAKGHLQRGSDPSVLPGDVLIADKLNNRLIIVDPSGRVRWEFPRKGDLAPGQTFRIPDDAFFTPDGRYIVATEEDDYAIRIIDVATHRIVYTYGKPGVPGSGPNRLDNPDDAIMLPDGDLVTADIKNQRLLLIAPGAHSPLRQWGVPGHGYHDPPLRYGAPNGFFPTPDGRFLVTEIRGDWVDSVDFSGHVFFSAHPDGVAYPSDSNQVGPNRYLTVDYSSPGQILIFDRTGRAIWRYRPGGKAVMNHPSLALPLPNGDIICNDDMNHRVIVVNPRTDRVVWQYGHTGVPGSAPGYLDNPDGLDLVPPYSLIDRVRPTARSG